MGLISEHKDRIEIEQLIKSGAFSYRELQTELLTRFGLKISYKSIQQYHTKELRGEVDIAQINEDEMSGFLELDEDEMSNFLGTIVVNSKTWDGKEDRDKNVKNSLAEIFTYQLFLTKAALKAHIKGQKRYPSEHIKNLQILSNLLIKR